MPNAAVLPFTLNIDQAELDYLASRLDNARWPEAEPVDDWSQGAPLEKVKALCAYWRDEYDWRRCEAMLNSWGQFKTNIDGLDIHFLHIRSPNRDAMPMLLTHGWPGSVLEFRKVIGPLTDPAAHGGDPADAFHLIIPSLPGYGFSDKPTRTGWGVERIAEAWGKLMHRLGYDHWVAQGGDWGSMVTSMIGAQRPRGCQAIHINMLPIRIPAFDKADLTDLEKAALASVQHYKRWDSGYAYQQGSRPQTLGYGLHDSPVGQAAWIYEKLWAWTDNRGAPEDVFSMDEMLDNIMMYWLPGTATSSARLYWQSLRNRAEVDIDMPTGISLFPKEIFFASRRWAETVYKNIVHWSEMKEGGHFAAWEQPEPFTQQVRECFRQFR